MATVSITKKAEEIDSYIESGVAVGPLSSLYTKTSDRLSNYRYPYDLGASNPNSLNNKNHWVTFSIYDVEPGNYNKSINKITLSPTLAAAGAVSPAILGAINGYLLGGAVGAGFGAVYGTLNSSSLVAASTLLGTVGLNITEPLTEVKSTISLYMPDTLAATYTSSYEEMNLSADLGPTVATLRAIDSIGGNDSTLTQKLKNIGNDSSTTPGLLAAATNFGTSAGVNIGNIASFALKAQGYSINPQVQMIYRGTGLRTFDLTFTLTPKSQDEAEVINSIINQFRFYSSPSLSSSSDPTNSMFLVPPSQFKLDFYVNGQPSNVLPKYGKCVLTSMDVNDAPNGFAAYPDGSMVQRQLTLSFKELDMLTRDYFKQSGVNGDQRR
jgi:hypothetical protein